MTTVNLNVHIIHSSPALGKFSQEENDIDDDKTEGEQQKADSRQARQHSSRTDMLHKAAAKASHIFSRNGTARLASLQQGRTEQNCVGPT